MLIANHHPFAAEFMRNAADPAWRWGNDMLEPNDVLSVAESLIIPVYARCGETSNWCGLPFFSNLEAALLQMKATEAEWSALRRLEDICREVMLRKFEVLAMLPPTTHIDDMTVVTENFISARATQERLIQDLELELAHLRGCRRTPLNLIRRMVKRLAIAVNAVPIAQTLAGTPSDLLAGAIADCVHLMRQTRAFERRVGGSASIEALARFARDTFGMNLATRSAAG